MPDKFEYKPKGLDIRIARTKKKKPPRNIIKTGISSPI